MAIVEFNNLTKSYGNFGVINNLSLQMFEGRIIGLLGPNGSGKSTIIKLVNGLIPVTSGEIFIDGKTIGVETKKIISYLPERTYLNKDMTAKEYIKFFKDFYSDFDCNKAFDLLKKLDVDPNKKLKLLSKGMKEKVQLVLVLSRDTKLYILDEPIAGVDPASRDYILSLIKENMKSDATMIICTHLISDIESILDDVIFLNHGQVMLYDSAENVRSKYEGSIDRAFREVFRCF